MQQHASSSYFVHGIEPVKFDTYKEASQAETSSKKSNLNLNVKKREFTGQFLGHSVIRSCKRSKINFCCGNKYLVGCDTKDLCLRL